MKEETEKKLSPYTIVNKWIYNEPLDSPFPAELGTNETCPLSATFILYHFTHLGVLPFINSQFNTLYIFGFPKVEMLKLVKRLSRIHNYRPPFIPPSKKADEEVLKKHLIVEYPLLKKYEIDLLIDRLKKNPEQHQLYMESVGLAGGKTAGSSKKKTKAKEFSKLVAEIDGVEPEQLKPVIKNKNPESENILSW